MAMICGNYWTPERMRAMGQETFSNFSQMLGYDGRGSKMFERRFHMPTNDGHVSVASDRRETDYRSTARLSILLSSYRAELRIQDLRTEAGEPIPLAAPEIDYQSPPTGEEVFDQLVSTITHTGRFALQGVRASEVIDLGFDEGCAASFVGPCISSLKNGMFRTFTTIDVDPMCYI